jgi:hypothetical protein
MDIPGIPRLTDASRYAAVAPGVMVFATARIKMLRPRIMFCDAGA